MAARVVITGIGVVSPIGKSREAFWLSCLAGRSGARLLDSPWVSETDIASKIAATVDGYGAADAGIAVKRARTLDRTSLFAIGAARQAWIDGGLDFSGDDGFDRRRLATVIGSGIGGLSSLERSHGQWHEQRTKLPVKRYSLPMLIPNAPAGQVAIEFGARGECKAISTACAAGTMAIGDGWRMLMQGEADMVLAGGADGVAGDHDAFGLMGFDRLNTLSTRNDEPQRASRPFDRDRDGFVLSEGGAVLLLEREDHARARGARIHATIAGYAANCDGHSMMQPDESGESVRELIGSVLQSAQLGAGDVEHISAHGTSTVSNDRMEARAFGLAFGDRVSRIPVTALKSMTGHAIGASGPMEVAALAMSMRAGQLTPTINYDHPDPDCPLDIVAGEPRETLVRVALKTSYGFGGHNAALVLTVD